MSDGATADGASRGPRRRVVVILAALGVAGGAIGWALRGRTPATEVSGTVTSDGRPVVFGTVTLLAVDRRAYSAAIGADGRFTVSNVPPGPVQIAVSSPDPTAPAGAMARGQRDTAAPMPSRPTAAAPGQGAGADAVDPPPGTTIAAPKRHRHARDGSAFRAAMRVRRHPVWGRPWSLAATGSTSVSIDPPERWTLRRDRAHGPPCTR